VAPFFFRDIYKSPVKSKSFSQGILMGVFIAGYMDLTKVSEMIFLQNNASYNIVFVPSFYSPFAFSRHSINTLAEMSFTFTKINPSIHQKTNTEQPVRVY